MQYLRFRLIALFIPDTTNFEFRIFALKKTHQMEITGTISSLLELQTGEGRNGPWKKQEFILETDDQYPRKVCIAVWGEKIDQFELKTGEKVTVSINVESREFNGRWYTDVKAWKIDKAATQSAPPPPPPPDYEMEEPASGFPDDLPF